MRLCLFASLIGWALLPSTVHAQGGSYVLRAARLWDGRAGEMQSPGVVAVVNGRITAVGGKPELSAATQVIDLGDATLLPGFMDAHTHLSSEITMDSRQAALDGLQRTIPEVALRATEYTSKTLLAGFTTVRDLGAQEFVDIALRNAIAAGKVIGPRMLVATHSLGTTGGHCDTNGFRPGLFGLERGVTRGIGNSPEEFRAAVRHNVKYGADLIKTCATGGVLSLNDDVQNPQLTQAELDALVDQAHSLGKRAAAHAHGKEGAKRAIRAGIDSIEHGTFMDDEALEMMKARGVHYVPTLMATKAGRERLDSGAVADPRVVNKMRQAIAAIDATIERALARGVPFAFGTDAGTYPHGRNGEEFHELVRRGMKPVDALRAATSVNARLFGVDDRLGTLAAGMIADIVAVPGDPLKDIRVTEKVLFVMKEGRVFKRP